MELLRRNLNRYRTNAAARVRLEEPKLRVNVYFRETWTLRLPHHECAYVCIYVRQSKKKVHSPLAGGSISDRLPFSMATNLSGAGPPHPPPSHLPFLPAKDPYRRSAAPEAAGRAARIGSQGSSPRAHALQRAPLWQLSCHWDTYTRLRVSAVAMRTMCYLWEPVRSPGGWHGVGEHLCNTADCTLLRSDKCTGCWLLTRLVVFFQRCFVFCSWTHCV